MFNLVTKITWNVCLSFLMIWFTSVGVSLRIHSLTTDIVLCCFRLPVKWRLTLSIVTCWLICDVECLIKYLTDSLKGTVRLFSHFFVSAQNVCTTFVEIQSVV